MPPRTQRSQTAPRPTIVRPRAPITRRPGGFSLLELLIVIVIIGVLSSILFVGFGAIRRSQDNRNTRAALEVARSMFNAYVNSARAGGNNVTSGGGSPNTTFYLRLAPSTWRFNSAVYGSAAGTIDIPALRAGSATQIAFANTLDYYNVPNRKTQDPTDEPVPMDVPNYPAGDPSTWSQTTPIDKWQLAATMNTLRRLRSSPGTKTLWSSLRESQIAHVGAVDSREDYIIDSWGHPLMFVPGTGVRGLQFGTGAPGNRPTPTEWLNGNPKHTAGVA